MQRLRPQLALDRVRPSWLTGGMIRLGVLSAFVVLVGMIRSRMTHQDAWIIFGVGVGLAATGAVLFAVGSRRLTERLSLGYRAAGILLLLRRTGLPLLGLAFFLVWTIVYVGSVAFTRPTRSPGSPRAALRRLLLLRGLDGVHLAARGHLRQHPRRPERDDDRDAHRFRAADGVPVQLRRLLRATARAGGCRASTRDLVRREQREERRVDALPSWRR